MLLTAWMLVLFSAADPIGVAETSLDVGPIYAGQPLKREFTIRNSGSEALTITDLRASCGCAAPTIDRRYLPPGESARIQLEINTLSQPAGPIRWTVTVGWKSGGAEGQRALELTAHLIREIELQPAAMAFVAQPGFYHDIVLTDRRPKPLVVQAVHTDTDRLRAELLPGQSPESRIIRVHITDDCPASATAATLCIATNDPKYSELRMPITVTCKPMTRVTSIPERPTVTPGNSVLVQLRGRDGETIRIDRVETSNAAITARGTDGPGNFSTLRIGLDKSKWDGRTAPVEVKVHLASPAGETIVLPVRLLSDD